MPLVKIDLLEDLPYFYTGISEWAACLALIVALRGDRGSLARRLLSAVVFFGVQVGWMCALPESWWFLRLGGAWGWMLCALSLNLRGRPAALIAQSGRAFLIAEFSAAFEWQMDTFFRSRLPAGAGQGVREAVSLLCLVFFVGGTCFLIFLLERGMQRKSFTPQVGWQEALVSMLTVFLVFSLSNLSFITASSPFSATSATGVYAVRALCDFAGLLLLYAGQYRMVELGAQRQLERTEGMLRTQYEHYRSYQEAIDRINLRYHDLRHELAAIRAESDADRRTDQLDALADALEDYAPEQQTGSRVLDGLIDERLPRLRRAGIHFTCVCDGALLERMHVTDLCTIFGEALDNAIESTALEEDAEQRLIHLVVNRRRDFLFVGVDNPCSHELTLRDGFPVSTKEGAGAHGYGLRSIALAAQKYDGSMSFSVQQGQFHLRVLIPLGEE